MNEIIKIYFHYIINIKHSVSKVTILYLSAEIIGNTYRSVEKIFL